MPLAAGEETSVAATKTYLASLAAISQLVAEWADDPALRAALQVRADHPSALVREHVHWALSFA